MRCATIGIIAAGLVGLAAGCGGGSTTSTPPPPPPPPPLASVELTGPAAVLEAGATLQLVATAKDGSGATLSGQSFNWTTSSPSTATVSAQGQVRGVSAGAATITVSSGGRSANLALSVRDTTSLPTTLSGRIDRVSLTLAAGQTYRVTGDLVMFADSSLRILGNVELDPGVTAIFFSTGTLDVTGDVGPAPAVAALRLPIGGAAVGAPTETVFGGQRVNIGGNVSGDGSIFIAGANTGSTNFSIVTIGPGAQVAPFGAAPGTALAKDGRTGYDLEIGTGLARGKLGTLGPYGGPIRRLRILQSSVSGGRGGNGYTLTRQDGVIANNRWDGTAGRGGKGGILAIQVDELEVTGSTVTPGGGGFGGAARLVGPSRLADGSGPNGEGESLFLQVGSGGDAGAIEILAGQVVTADRFREGLVGEGGEPDIHGGSGLAGGSGGDLTIRMGESGGRSRVVVPAGIAVEAPNPPLAPLVLLSDAANGSDATVPGRIGGAGGLIIVEGPVPLSVPLAKEIRLTRVAKGGRGYNGCGVSPFVNGTDGGTGGRLLSGGVPVVGGGDFNGGRGGDGLPNAGSGGAAGTHLGNPFGLIGASGNPCPVISVQPSEIIINSQRPVGQCNDNGFPSGSITIRNLVTTPTSYSINIVNIQGASGIGLIPGGATTGPNLPTVSGTAPGSGQHVIWYDFDPCAARDGGGNAKAELRIGSGNQMWIVPVTVTMP
jgi:hypothetical protein